MYCKSCGKELETESAYCPHCGAPTGETPRQKKSLLIPVLVTLVAVLCLCVIAMLGVSIANRMEYDRIWDNLSKTQGAEFEENDTSGQDLSWIIGQLDDEK